MNSSTAARTNQGQTLVRSRGPHEQEITRSGLVSTTMRLLLNLIWLVFGGLVMAAGYALAALVMLILIITIPFGIASARIALFCLWPFGRTIVRRPDAGAGSLIGNVIWFVLAGWWLAIGHLVTGVLMCLTIIGIPLGLANFKLIPVSLTPFGREIVDIDQARRLGIQPAVTMPADPSARAPALKVPRHPWTRITRRVELTAARQEPSARPRSTASARVCTSSFA